MAARAKERQRAAPAAQDDTPPSASNPSASLNVGKEEGQQMGMEGRAARLGAKSAQQHETKKQQEKKKAAADDDSSSSQSSSVSLGDVSRKLAATSMEGDASGHSAASEHKMTEASPVTKPASAPAPAADTAGLGAKTARQQQQKQQQQQEKKAKDADSSSSESSSVSLGDISKKLAATSVKDNKSGDSAAASQHKKTATSPVPQLASAPASASEVEVRKTAEGEGDSNSEASQQLLGKIVEFLDGTQLEISSLRSAMGAGDEESVAKLDKAAHSKMLQTLSQSMAELDVAMETLEHLRYDKSVKRDL